MRDEVENNTDTDCPACSGKCYVWARSGNAQEADKVACDYCGGDGWVSTARRNIGLMARQSSPYRGLIFTSIFLAAVSLSATNSFACGDGSCDDPEPPQATPEPPSEPPQTQSTPEPPSHSRGQTSEGGNRDCEDRRIQDQRCKVKHSGAVTNQTYGHGKVGTKGTNG